MMIKFLEHLFSFIANLVWIPWFISPPENTPVDYMTDQGYIMSGTYKDSLFQMYPEKRSPDKTWGWRYRGQITLPKPSFGRTRSFGVTILTNPRSDNVWDFVDGAGEKHHVSYNTKKYLEENPFGSTIEGKRKKMEEKKEQQTKKQFDKIKKIKGNTL